MAFIINRSRTPTVLIASMTVFSLANASVISFKGNDTTLASENPISASLGITQFGMPGDDKYVFCHERDCQHRTTKHIFVAEVSKPIPLIMPEPTRLDVLPVIETVSLKPVSTSHKRKIRKPVKKGQLYCNTKISKFFLRIPLRARTHDAKF